MPDPATAIEAVRQLPALVFVADVRRIPVKK